eukprot:6194481-Pleurochrysis_carterae.AAC.4
MPCAAACDTVAAAVAEPSPVQARVGDGHCARSAVLFVVFVRSVIQCLRRSVIQCLRWRPSDGNFNCMVPRAMRGSSTRENNYYQIINKGVWAASLLAGVIRPTYTVVRGYMPPRGIEGRSTDGHPTLTHD